MLKAMCNLKKASALLVVAFCLSAPLALLMGGGLATATDVTVDYNVNIAPSLNVDLSSSSVVLNLNPNSKTFGYEDIDVKVSTNYEAGYELKMSTADNSTDLKRNAAADSVNASINTLTATSPATTGYTDSDFSNCTTANCMNKWGYKNGLSNNYFPFASNATILNNTTATNEDSTTLRFAAKIDYDLPAGAYSNELIFTATANPITYGINYYNGYDTTSAGIIGKQDDSAGTAAYTTLAPKDPTTGNPIATPTRSTYTFAGWCIDNTNRTNVAVNSTTLFDSTNKIYSNPGTVCNGTTYQTGDILTLNPNDANNINIYAMWTSTTVAQAYGATAMTMQNMSPSICAAITPNQWGIVTDARDNQQYHIAKLEDSRCWMLDNLALDISDSVIRNNLSSSNTHASDTALNYLKGVNTGTASNQWSKAAASSWAGVSYTKPFISKSGTCNTTSSFPCTYNGNYIYNTDLSTLTPAQSTYGVGYGKIGIYYNYCAVSAGSYCWGNSDSDAGSHTESAGFAIVDDICSANWMLPVGGTTGDSVAILDSVINNRIASNPFSLQHMLSVPLSGYYANEARYQGTYGSFWSSGFYNETGMYGTATGATIINLRNYNTRAFGYLVRCIAQ